MARFTIAVLTAGTLVAITGGAYADEAADIKACNGGKAVKCEEIAERALLESQKAMKKEPQDTETVQKESSKAFTYLTKACDFKSGRACNNLGTAWSEGKDGAAKVDHVKAGGLYKKACELKNGLGCFNLGNVHRLGEGVTIDLKVAFANFQKACELTEAKGCTEEAIMHYEGKAVKKDVPKAKELLEKACKLGSQTACKNAELLKNAK